MTSKMMLEKALYRVTVYIEGIRTYIYFVLPVFLAIYSRIPIPRHYRIRVQIYSIENLPVSKTFKDSIWLYKVFHVEYFFFTIIKKKGKGKILVSLYSHNTPSARSKIFSHLWSETSTNIPIYCFIHSDLV